MDTVLLMIYARRNNSLLVTFVKWSTDLIIQLTLHRKMVCILNERTAHSKNWLHYPFEAADTLTTQSYFSIGMLAKLYKQRQNNRIIVTSKDAELFESYSININTTNGNLYQIYSNCIVCMVRVHMYLILYTIRSICFQNFASIPTLKRDISLC